MEHFSQVLERVFQRWIDRAPDIAENLGLFFVILTLTLLTAKLVRRLIRRLLNRPQTETISPVLASLAAVVIWGMGLVTGFSQLGINVGAVLAGAGVVGLAVGFGAQTLVKDLISGFFLIFDGVIRVGDQVRVDTAEGVVEAVGLRMTRIRAFDGKLWYVPNGSINVVANASREWGRVVVEVGISYSTDLEKALYVLKQCALEFAQSKGSDVLESPEAQGVLALGDSSVLVRVVMKVRAEQKIMFERELRQKIKIALDQESIEIPFPTRVLVNK